MDFNKLKMPKPPKRGRPTKITQDILNKLEQAFMLGCTDGEASLFAGISTTTLYNYQIKHPEFIVRKSDLRDNPVLLARQAVIDGLGKDHAHALKVMERLSKDYKQKKEVEVTSDSFESILVELSKKPKDE